MTEKVKKSLLAEQCQESNIHVKESVNEKGTA